jgi:tetratricopeptide (TPR) repeat protein
VFLIAFSPRGEICQLLQFRHTAAQEAFHKGQFELAKFTVEGTQAAILHFEQAIREDPNYALVYIWLARSYIRLGQPLSAMPPREAMPKAEELAMKALEIDSSLGAAHAILGTIKRNYYKDWAGAEKEFKLALELNSSSVEAYSGYAFLMTSLGCFEEAITLRMRTIRLDPLNLGQRTALAEHLFNARRYDEAMEELETVLEMDPNFQRAYNLMSWVYEAKGMYELRSRSRSNEEALHVVRSDLPKQEKLVAEAQKALAQASKAPEAIDVVTTELKARTAKLKKLQCRLGKIDSESERLEAELKNLEACYAEAGFSSLSEVGTIALHR